MTQENKQLETAYMRTEALSVGYRGKALISGIDVQIRKGAILTLIGPNGAGKSTIIKNIICDMTPVAGGIYMDGKNIRNYGGMQLAKKMSVVLTEKIKTEMMTCREVVAMGRYPYTNYFGRLTKEDEQIVEESLEKVSALDIADQDFAQISDGQRQRIMLARAICQKPEIIVLDEPTSFLDIRHKIELLDILVNMAVQEQVTVIVSLHEIELASKIADYVMCVRADGGYDFGTPQEIFTDERIQQLYGIQKGSYHCLYGSTELKKPEGKPQVFVAGGAGTGIYAYRELQRHNIAFTAGIIYENDCDYPVAAVLAQEVITEKPFEPMGEEAYQKACRAIDAVSYVIDTECPVGAMNGLMKQVLAYAKDQGKQILKKSDIKILGE